MGRGRGLTLWLRFLAVQLLGRIVLGSAPNRSVYGALEALPRFRGDVCVI